MAQPDKITVGGVYVVEVDFDPSSSGLSAPVGSFALNNITGQYWSKTAAGNTAWTLSPIDSNGVLAALAAYNTNGILTQTALATFTGRTLTAGSTKISITNGNGVSGNPTIDAVEANFSLNNIGGTLNVSKGGTGLTTFGGTNTLLYTTTTDTLSSVTTANNGVLITSGVGAPSISSTLPLAVQGNITTVGTIGTGTWNGAVVSPTYGGTGVNNGSSTITLAGNLVTTGAFSTTLAQQFTGTVTLPNATSTLATLALTEALSNKTLGNTNTVTLKDTNFTLQDDGDITKQTNFQLSGITTGNTRTLTVPDNSGTIRLIADVVGVAQGGTNIVSYAVGDLIYASASTTLSKLADVAAGSYLRSGGVTTAPVWSTLTLPNAATTGDLLFANASNAISTLADVAVGSYLRSGGVGTAPVWSTLVLPNAATSGDLLTATSTNTYASLAKGTANQVLGMNNAATTQEYKTVTAGTNISIVHAANSITIATSGTAAIFGSGYQKFTSLNEQSTTSATLVNALSATATSLTSGTYFVSWAFEVSTSGNNQDVTTFVSIGGTQISGRTGTGAHNTANTATRITNFATEWRTVSGIFDLSLSGTPAILVQYAVSGGTAFIRNINVMLWRVA